MDVKEEEVKKTSKRDSRISRETRLIGQLAVTRKNRVRAFHSHVRLTRTPPSFETCIFRPLHPLNILNMSASLVRASALGLGAGLPTRKSFQRNTSYSSMKRSAGRVLRVVAEDTNWGREVSVAVVRIGAGVLMIHNGLDKLVDPEVRAEGATGCAVVSIFLVVSSHVSSFFIRLLVN